MFAEGDMIVPLAGQQTCDL